MNPVHTSTDPAQDVRAGDTKAEHRAEKPADSTRELSDGGRDELGEGLADLLLPLLPGLMNVSGLYVRRGPWWLTTPGATTRAEDAEIPAALDASAHPLPLPRPLPLPQPFPSQRIVEEIRLDVDGQYPQMRISGYIRSGLVTTAGVHWIADLAPAGSNAWQGSIWYKDGNQTLLPHTDVKVTATRSLFPANRKLAVTFLGAGARATRVFSFESASFRKVEFEYDTVAGSAPVFSIGTCAHPNRPASMPCEQLEIETVFRRAGFNVTKSGGDSQIPVANAGADQLWSDQEMHDAMQVHWSRFANNSQWSLWVLWAALHQQGTGLGGIMFDDIGPNHRQGTAIFTDSFISQAPANDPNAAAWVARMKFWTAVHEMGHAFNLAHSWQKQHPPQWGTPWIPIPNEPEARSFMNYPYNVSGGQTAFFADFAYRFSDQELLFMRHAPEHFVQMGNADWFDNHAFEEAIVSPEPDLALEVRVNRAKPEFEFLEPVVVELKATNISGRPLVLDRHLLEDAHDLTVVVKRDRTPARQWRPFATRCLEPDLTVLAPGQSMYHSLFVAVGTNGWDMAEPGRYLVQASLRCGEEDIVSNPLTMRIMPPRGYEEETLAQDMFTDDVGRVLAFDGSRVLMPAINTLREIAEKLPDRQVAAHALVAVALPLRKKMMVLDEREGKPVIWAAEGDPKEARQCLHEALVRNPDAAAQTLGHIDYREYVETYAHTIAEAGDDRQAAKLQSMLAKTLAGRNVLASVVEEIRARTQSYTSRNA